MARNKISAQDHESVKISLASAISKVKQSHADPENKELANIAVYGMMVCYRRALMAIKAEEIDDPAYLAHMVLYLETV